MAQRNISLLYVLLTQGYPGGHADVVCCQLLRWRVIKSKGGELIYQPAYSLPGMPPRQIRQIPPTYPTPLLQTHLAQTSFTFLFPEGLHFQVKGDRIFGTGEYCNLTSSLDGADLMKPENRKNMLSVKDTGVQQKINCI